MGRVNVCCCARYGIRETTGATGCGRDSRRSTGWVTVKNGTVSESGAYNLKKYSDLILRVVRKSGMFLEFRVRVGFFRKTTVWLRYCSEVTFPGLYIQAIPRPKRYLYQPLNPQHQSSLQKKIEIVLFFLKLFI